jgi:hypothetical protein
MMTLLMSHGIMLMKPLEHQARNLPRQASKMNTYQRRARMRAQEVEEGEEDANDSSNEELEEDPHDDIDVTDSDEGSGGGDEEENDP